VTVPVVALVGDHLRHRWYASQLALSDAVELRGVVSERQPPQPSGRDEVEDELVADHFARRRAAEERHFGGAPGWEELGAPFLAVERGETNSQPTARWVDEHEPELLALYGCGIIRAPLLEDHEAVNIHLGLSPYYKGHATNFWPLVNGEPECVGATVHLATLDVDAGPILRQARPLVVPEDDSHDIGCKALAAGVDALLDALPAYAARTLDPVAQQAGGRIYRHADFDAAPGEAIAELRRRFAAGMIPNYLAEKALRDAQFPIVE
jgi:methionyl-tRNA formyltransferase